MNEESVLPTINGFVAISRQDYPEYGILQNDVVDTCIHDESVVCSHYKQKEWVEKISHTWIPVENIDVPEPVEFSIPEE